MYYPVSRLRFELRTYSLRGKCSTIELPARFDNYTKFLAFYGEIIYIMVKKKSYSWFLSALSITAWEFSSFIPLSSLSSPTAARVLSTF